MKSLNGVTQVNGMLFKDGVQLLIHEAQFIAASNGFQYAWQLVEYLYEQEIIGSIRLALEKEKGQEVSICLLDLIKHARLADKARSLLSGQDWGDWNYSDRYDKDTNPDLLRIKFTKKK